MTKERVVVMDFLPPVYLDKVEVFIKAVDEEAFTWKIFVAVFTIKLWIMIFFVAAIMALVLISFERLNEVKSESDCLMDYLTYFWMAFRANFGGNPTGLRPKRTFGDKMALFICLLVGSIIWMGYRASLTSELSISKKRLPFHDLNGLLKSNYR